MRTSVLFILVFSLSYANAGNYLNGSKWDHLEVSVCWAPGASLLPLADNADHPMIAPKMSPAALELLKKSHPDYELPIKRIGLPSEEFREAVQKIIEKQFSSERTGILYTGWKICGDSPSEDVMLFYIKSAGKGLSTIGNGLFEFNGKSRSLDGKKPTVFLQLSGNSNVDDGDKKIIVHEFGHLAGLLHEDISTDLYLSARTFYTARDFSSVMNEGFFPDMEGVNGLSEGDLHALKCIYKPQSVVTPKTCEPVKYE